MRMRLVIGFILSSLFAVSAAAEAPAMPTGPFATAKLSWKWVPGPDGGEPTEIYIRCARGNGPRNIEKVVDGATTSILARDVVLRPGRYDCTWMGWNDTGEGPVSDPFPFGLDGGLPPAITDITLE